MLDASGYGCLDAHRTGERHSASSYKFVNVHFPACYILLYLVSDDCGGSASCTVVIVCVYRCVCQLLLLNIGNRESLTESNKAFKLSNEHFCQSFDKAGR